MIEFIKNNKIKFLLIILLILVDAFVISINFISSKKDIITPGGLNEVKSVIEVKDAKEILGSFNTLYVYSYDKASILKTFIANFSEYNDISDSSITSNLSYKEQLLAGKIQKNQSIECSLICAYNYAKKSDGSINLEYKFEGFLVSYIEIQQTILEIGDLIVSVTRDGIVSDINNPSLFVDMLNSLKVGDIIGFIRDNEEMNYLINEL